MIKKCLYCKKEFKKRIKENSYNFRRRKHCSQKCYIQSLKPIKKYKKCIKCNKKFTRIDGRSWKYFLKKQKYCSRKCFFTKRKGEKRPPFNKEWINNMIKSHLKTGRTKREGRIFIYKRNHPFASASHYVPRSRLVMEKTLKRYLQPQEIVHHINGIKDDDSPENLRLFTNHTEHIKFHWLNMSPKKKRKNTIINAPKI
jgi:hypothetical protein